MKVKSTLIVLSLIFGLFACSHNSGVLKEAQPATLQNTTLKSAPAPTSNDGQFHLWMRGVDNTQFVAGGGTLVHVDLVQKGNSKTGEKRVAIFDSTWNGPEHFNDLLTMSSGIMLDLFDGEVNPPPGNYDYAIATVVPGSGWLVTKNGDTCKLKFPGNKFMLAFKPAVKIVTMVSPDVVLDIDVNRSFVQTGKSYIFKPVVKVVNATTAGSLIGGVYTLDQNYSPVPIGNATISLDGIPYFITSDQPITDPTSGYTINPGEYWIPGIPAGTYTVSASAAGYTMSSAQVTILEGNFTQKAFILTPQ